MSDILIENAVMCDECGATTGHELWCSQYIASSISVYEQLINSTSLLEFRQILLLEENYYNVVALTSNEIIELKLKVNVLYDDILIPTEDEQYYYEELIETLNYLPNAEIEDGEDGNGQIGELPSALASGYYSGNNIFYANESTASLLSNYRETTISYNSAEDAILLSAGTSNDTGVFFSVKDLGLSADVCKYIVITYKTNKSGTNSQLFLLNTGGSTGANANYQKSYSCISDGKYHSQIINLSNNSWWTGTIHGFRFDYFGTSIDGDYMYVDSIIFCETEEDANYYVWERELVRNNNGKFVASPEMVRLFSKAHNVVASYDEEQQAIKLLIEKNCDTCIAGTHGSHFNNSSNADPFDPQIVLNIPSALSSDYTYVSITYMCPDISNVIGTDADGDDHYDIDQSQLAVRVGLFPTMDGADNNYSDKYERNFTIESSGVYYSNVIDLASEYISSSNRTIRIDPFNFHFVKAGSILYLQSVMFCKTEEEAKKESQSQLESRYPYNYILHFDGNADGDTISGLPSDSTTIMSDKSTHLFTVSYDEPSRVNYIFKGWATTPDAIQVEYIAGQNIELTGMPNETTSLTLYAVWEVGSGKITYETNIDGAILSDGTMLPYVETYLQTNSFTLKNAELDGYEFQSWLVTRNASSGSTWEQDSYAAGEIMPTGMVGDVILTAQWSKLRYELHYHSTLIPPNEEGEIVYNSKIFKSKLASQPFGSELNKEDCDSSSVTWADLFPDYEFVGWESNDEYDTDEVVNLYAIWERK